MREGGWDWAEEEEEWMFGGGFWGRSVFGGAVAGWCEDVGWGESRRVALGSAGGDACSMGLLAEKGRKGGESSSSSSASERGPSGALGAE